MKYPLMLVTAASIATATHLARPLFAESEHDSDDPSTLRIAAEKLTFDPQKQRISASGCVRLELDEHVLQADSALVDLRQGLVDLGPPLQLNLDVASVEAQRLRLIRQEDRLELEQPSFEVRTTDNRWIAASAENATCSAGLCELSSATGTACPHSPTAYSVRAEKITLHPSGDVDLLRPTLVVGDTTVAALPWLRLRPPDTPGLLPPRMAWNKRGGLILGPAGQIPVSDDLVLSGHAAVRTAQGFETSSSATLPFGHVTVDQLYDVPEIRLRSRFHLAPDLANASLVVDGDLVDGRKIIDDLEFDPLERAKSHTASRALLSSSKGDHFFVENHLAFIQTFDGQGRFDRGQHATAFGVSTGLLPAPQIGPIWPALSLALTRRNTFNGVPALDAAGGLAPEHTQLVASPSLSHSGRFGSIAADFSIGSRHQLWLPDGTGWSRTMRQAAAASVGLQLPLARDYGELRHAVGPLVRYRLTPWTTGSSPSWVMDDLDRLRNGHGLEAGFETWLGRAGAGDALRLSIHERFDLPGFGIEPGPAYLYLSAGVGPPWLRLQTEGSWDHYAETISHARLTLATADRRGNRLETGGSWYGPGRGAHLDRPWSTSAGPWITESWIAAPTRALELAEQAAFAFSRYVRATAGARVGVVPDARLHALWYGLELGSSCRCLTAGIVASHRLESWLPDVMATISLHDQ